MRSDRLWLWPSGSLPDRQTRGRRPAAVDLGPVWAWLVSRKHQSSAGKTRPRPATHVISCHVMSFLQQLEEAPAVNPACPAPDPQADPGLQSQSSTSASLHSRYQLPSPNSHQAQEEERNFFFSTSRACCSAGQALRARAQTAEPRTWLGRLSTLGTCLPVREGFQAELAASLGSCGPRPVR